MLQLLKKNVMPEIKELCEAVIDTTDDYDTYQKYDIDPDSSVRFLGSFPAYNYREGDFIDMMKTPSRYIIVECNITARHLWDSLNMKSFYDPFDVYLVDKNIQVRLRAQFDLLEYTFSDGEITIKDGENNLLYSTKISTSDVKYIKNEFWTEVLYRSELNWCVDKWAEYIKNLYIESTNGIISYHRLNKTIKTVDFSLNSSERAYSALETSNIDYTKSAYVIGEKVESVTYFSDGILEVNEEEYPSYVHLPSLCRLYAYFLDEDDEEYQYIQAYYNMMQQYF